MYEIEDIIKKKVCEDGETRYLVTYKGYDDTTWNTAAELREGAKEVLTEFNNRKNPMAKKGNSKRKRAI